MTAIYQKGRPATRVIISEQCLQQQSTPTAVDALKFAGGSFTLMPRKAVKDIIDLCHCYNVRVSTGGFIERVLTLGSTAVNRYIEQCKALEFDIIEISSGFITIS